MGNEKGWEKGEFRIMQFIRGWFNKNVKWYQFWYPGSGFIGGCLIGLVLSILGILFIIF